ncbi:MAG: MBL fold metallo-hydrolase [Candidatus Tectomicrobia bacterium]|uniref:MBL fold metallo-hydrolase n=1 Tax=Tectimicrobiota bacterium TaxID=2528274 RepID=A0A932FWT2_UNCTE|nr:MBL fold metallo-hydrolase [Candidatus Tectomicrobia bacterium]
MQLLENVYAYLWDGYENNCNSFFFHDEINVLIDPGHTCFTDRLIFAMAADGWRPEDVDLVVDTHAHLDHCEGNARFLHADTVIAAMHPADLRYYEHEGAQLMRALGREAPPLALGGVLQEEIRLGRITLQVIPTPGHTPGGVCLYWPQGRVLVSGDTLFNGSIGRTDFPGADARQMRESLERLGTLEVEYLLPGHNDLVSGREQVRENFTRIQHFFFPMLG